MPRAIRDTSHSLIVAWEVPLAMTAAGNDIAEVLKLLNRAHDRVSTAEAVLHDCRYPFAGSTALTTVMTRLHLWWQPPSLRVEQADEGSLARVGVRGEETWRLWDADCGTTWGDIPDSEHPRSIPALLSPVVLEPARVLGWMRLDRTHEGVRAGRQVVAVSARPRRGSLADADQVTYELEFDAEHGTLLRSVSYRGDHCFHALEVAAINYGHPIDADRFVLSPLGDPAGRRVPLARLM